MEVEPLASIYGWVMKLPYTAYVFLSQFYGWFLWVQSLFSNQNSNWFVNVILYELYLYLYSYTQVYIYIYIIIFRYNKTYMSRWRLFNWNPPANNSWSIGH